MHVLIFITFRLILHDVVNNAKYIDIKHKNDHERI